VTLTTVTAADLMRQHFPDPKWAVPGLIAEGLNLLVGSPKLGKSWMCLDLAVQVASGGKAFGKIAVDPGSVLYAALEDQPRRLQSRLRKILDGTPAPASLEIVTHLGVAGEMVQQVGEWLDTHTDARLVIIDVVRKVLPRGDGRSLYETDYESMSALKALADKHAVALVAVHHSRKQADESDVMNEVSGSTGMTGAADAILYAKRGRNTAEAVLHVTGRDIEESTYGLRFIKDTCTWQLLDEPVELATMSDTRRTILNAITKAPGSTPTAIANATGLSLDLVKQTVRRMAEDDQLHNDGKGHYSVGDSVGDSVTAVTVSPTLDLPGDTGDTGDSEIGDYLVTQVGAVLVSEEVL
jgi:hypothetical protein